MTKELFEQIVTALLPLMNDAQERRSLIEAALFGSPVLQQLVWEGAARAFTIQLVQKLDAFGQIAPGCPALVALLEGARPSVGVDRQAKFDQLIAQLVSEIALAAEQRFVSWKDAAFPHIRVAAPQIWNCQ